MNFDAEQKKWEDEVLQPVISRFAERKERFETPSSVS